MKKNYFEDAYRILKNLIIQKEVSEDEHKIQALDTIIFNYVLYIETEHTYYLDNIIEALDSSVYYISLPNKLKEKIDMYMDSLLSSHHELDEL